MIRFLYKYMPLRGSFFDVPMIRATPTLALNDPFEGFINKIQIQAANRNHEEYYAQAGKQVNKMDEHEIDDLMGSIQFDFSELGILSFTEDNNNPLMWAHYADNHQGVVIEFDFDQPFFMDSLQELDGRKSRFGKSHLGDIYEFPQKVNYRREMPKFERPEFVNPDSITEFHWKKFNQSILFAKANDWIYEKEQRSIVRLRDADSIICEDSMNIRELCSKDEKIILQEIPNKRIQIIYPQEYEMHEEMGDESLKEEIYRESRTDSTIHLFRINPLAISGVYFGCNANHIDALEIIHKNPSLKHLNNKIFKMEVNSSLYQFDAINL